MNDSATMYSQHSLKMSFSYNLHCNSCGAMIEMLLDRNRIKIRAKVCRLLRTNTV